jgi:hypothetical protein
MDMNTPKRFTHYTITPVLFHNMGVYAVNALVMILVYLVLIILTPIFKKASMLRAWKISEYIKSKVVMRMIIIYYLSLSINFELYTPLNIIFGYQATNLWLLLSLFTSITIFFATKLLVASIK